MKSLGDYNLMKSRGDFMTKNIPKVAFPQPMIIQGNEGEECYSTGGGSDLTFRLQIWSKSKTNTKIVKKFPVIRKRTNAKYNIVRMVQSVLNLPEKSSSPSTSARVELKVREK